MGFALMEQQKGLSTKVKQMDAEVEKWKENFALWNADDFKVWVWQIDCGYFKRKSEQSTGNVFDDTKFAQKLNEIAARMHEDGHVKFDEFSFDATRMFHGK